MNCRFLSPSSGGLFKLNLRWLPETRLGQWMRCFYTKTALFEPFLRLKQDVLNHAAKSLPKAMLTVLRLSKLRDFCENGFKAEAMLADAKTKSKTKFIRKIKREPREKPLSNKTEIFAYH
jgi:hypothetical protein